MPSAIMPLTRWFFQLYETGKVHLYETTNNDPEDARPFRKRGGKELGPIKQLTTTEGKSKVLQDKYGAEYGIGVRDQEPLQLFR